MSWLGVHWNIQEYTGVYWSILEILKILGYTGDTEDTEVYGSILEKKRSILAYTELYWSILEYTGVYWSILEFTFSTMNVVMPCSLAAMSVLA